MTRTPVTLAVNATLTLDFRLGIAGLSENVTVTSASPLIELTQSKVNATVPRREVENLPLLTAVQDALRGRPVPTIRPRVLQVDGKPVPVLPGDPRWY